MFSLKSPPLCVILCIVLQIMTFYKIIVQRSAIALNYIILDMEWNQPFSKSSTKELNRIKLIGEIIQISAVKLNENQKIIDIWLKK